MATRRLYWAGSKLDKCEICRQSLTETVVDGKTLMGPWALMCPACYSNYGLGLGTGRGQMYKRQSNGRWLKTAG
jgi:hypothetical protein